MNGSTYVSRKWKLVVLVVILATIGAFLPPLVSVWLFGAEKPLVILSGVEWVSTISLIVAAYFGANVWQKIVQKQESITDSPEIDPEASSVDRPKADDDEGKEV